MTDLISDVAYKISTDVANSVATVIGRWAEARFAGCGGAIANVGRCELVYTGTYTDGHPDGPTITVDNVPEVSVVTRLSLDDNGGGKITVKLTTPTPEQVRIIDRYNESRGV